jgi:hypothetical protein
MITMRLGINLFVIVTGGGAGNPGEQSAGNEAEDDNPQKSGSALAGSVYRGAGGLANGSILRQHDKIPLSIHFGLAILARLARRETGWSPRFRVARERQRVGSLAIAGLTE